VVDCHGGRAPPAPTTLAAFWRRARSRQGRQRGRATGLGQRRRSDASALAASYLLTYTATRRLRSGYKYARSCSRPGARAGRANASCELCRHWAPVRWISPRGTLAARLGAERPLLSPRCGGLRRDEHMGLSSSKAKEAAPPPLPSEGKFGVRVRPAVPSTHSQAQPPSLSFRAAADFAGADREHARGERRPGYRTGRRRRRDPEPRGAQRDAPARLPGGRVPLWSTRPV
jgi:hypothetical protein